MKPIRIAVFTVIGVLIVLLAWGVFREPTNVASPLTGRPASDFTLQTFDGRRISLAELRGRPVVLNFWASWCLSCRDEARVLEQGWQSYGPKGAVFIGVAVSDERDESLAFIQQYGKTYLLGPDTRGSISLDYGLFGVPETFFISPDGTIVDKAVGPVTPELLAAWLEPYL